MAFTHCPHNLLITGGCGFIGSNFVNFIFNKWPNANIINFDKLAFGANEEHIEDYVKQSQRYKLIIDTLCNQKSVEDALSKYNIDTIIHFAAITHVDDSYSDRIGTIQENIISTTSLLEAVNKWGKLKKFVHISTDEVYGDSFNDNAPKSELSLMNPTNPYAASKAACEVIVNSYHHSYKLPYVMVRMNNVYGPRQAYSKLIPKFTKYALEGLPYPLMGDGMHSRSWMYVDDCAEAIRRVTEQGRIGQIYNIGTEFEKCNLHLTQTIHKIVNQLINAEESEPKFEHIPDRPYHDRRYFIDFSKIHNELNWNCTTLFENGLAKTINYYVEEHKKAQATTKAMRIHG
uniref:NAD(P)-bd_dom domain-containing protein n=1 Tax=Rhabditophanes sp. KR3021 TaxID=114890 RepID=A0AC35UIM5_9BILA